MAEQSWKSIDKKAWKNAICGISAPLSYRKVLKWLGEVMESESILFRKVRGIKGRYSYLDRYGEKYYSVPLFQANHFIEWLVSESRE